MKRRDKSTQLPQTAMFAAVAVLMVIAFVISICVGQFSISLQEIGAILTGGEVSGIAYKVFWNLRFPRTPSERIRGAV